MSQAIQTALETRSVEYLAFQSQEKIKLSVAIIKQFIAIPFYDKERKEYVYPSEAQCVKFMLLNRARQLNPFESDSFMIPFWDSKSNSPQWSLITAHNAFLKRAEVHPQYEGMESGVIVEVDGETKELEGDFVPDTMSGEKVRLVGGWAKVYRQGRRPMYKRAKLTTWQKDFGHWRVDPAGQITKIAEADALRSSFPNTLGGMYIQPEPGDIQVSSEPVAERRPELPAQAGPSGPKRRSLPNELPPSQLQTAANPPQEAPTAETAPTEQSEPESSPESQQQGKRAVSEPSAEMPATPEGTEPNTQDDPEPFPEFLPDKADTQPVQDVKRLLHAAGLSEANIMAWAKQKKVAKENQSHLAELAESKLVNIKASWATILPVIKQVNNIK